MKKFFISLFVLFFSSHCAWSTTTIAVLPIENKNISIFYYIYPSAATLIAQGVINEFSENKEITVINNFKGDDISENIINTNYKSSLVINRSELKNLANKKNIDYVLLIASSLDTQTHLLDTTWWNRLNIPGADVIEPKYNLMTNVSLVNVKTNNVLWEEQYEEKIKAKYMDLLTGTVSPNHLQLKNIKKHAAKVSMEIAEATRIYIERNNSKDENIEKVEKNADLQPRQNIIQEAKQDVENNIVDLSQKQSVTKNSSKKINISKNIVNLNFSSKLKNEEQKEIINIIDKSEDNNRVKVDILPKNKENQGRLFKRTFFIDVKDELIPIDKQSNTD